MHSRAVHEYEKENKRINFDLAEYQPIQGIIIEGYHKSNVRMLCEELSLQGVVNVLLANTDEDIDGVIQSMCDAKITRFETDQTIELLEHVYHLEQCTLTGGNIAYWQELLEESLPFLKTERGLENVLEI